MPNRFVSISILIVWAYATFALLRRDVLPELLIGPAPDLRAVARAQDDSAPSRWSLLVADDAEGINLRAVGQAESQTRRSRDGWMRLQSRAWFDAKELLRGTPLESGQDDRVEVDGIFDIDAGGNLESFRASVSFAGLPRETLVLSGRVESNQLRINSQGPLPLLNWSRTFPYEPRELVQSPMAPLERLPGLQVGQRWSSRIVSPLTGRVEQVQVAVDRRRVITWDGNPVTTFEVVSRVGLISARTWVRAEDGLVLRQEAPLPFVRIVLERLPQRYHGPGDPAEEARR